MSLICAISNEVPDHPVVSPFSGVIFERKLIEKYINENGKDPITGDDMTIDQLIEIKIPPMVKPRPPTATSIPAILKLLQDEWDATMLHTFTLRQQLQSARQELSHALYQHDAACRVIARLTKEVTAAREALATLKPHGVPQQQNYGPEAVEVGGEQQLEEVGLSDDVIAKLQDKAAVLTAARKQRGKTVPEGLAKPEDIANYHQLAAHTGLHSASNPGITALDIHAADSRLILTGGNDKNAVVFNKETEQIVATFKGHQKKITSVIFHPTEHICFSASPDCTIRVWSMKAERPQLHIMRPHEAAITGISLHATGDYLLSVSEDEKWAFSDVRSGRILCRVSDPASAQAMTCAQFHPDGLIFGTGTADAMVKIWDLKERTNVANFPGHTGVVRAISFSENGYYLATAADDAVIKLWDLRKLKNFRSIDLGERYQVNDLCFDQSGTYLAVAGTDARVYHCKQWQDLVILKEHGDVATGIRFGKDSTFLASSSMDRSLRIYGS